MKILCDLFWTGTNMSTRLVEIFMMTHSFVANMCGTHGLSDMCGLSSTCG